MRIHHNVLLLWRGECLAIWRVRYTQHRPHFQPCNSWRDTHSHGPGLSYPGRELDDPYVCRSSGTAHAFACVLYALPVTGCTGPADRTPPCNVTLSGILLTFTCRACRILRQLAALCPITPKGRPTSGVYWSGCVPPILGFEPRP